jgi:DNA-binding CsgD family transcriptional regulator
LAQQARRPFRRARIARRLLARFRDTAGCRPACLVRRLEGAAGYAVTLEAAPADDLAPLLMRAWGLTRREPEVAQLVIDGLSTEDIANVLFTSVHTVRDHLKTMFGKTGVSRRQDLAAVLTGRTPTSAHVAP